MAIIDDTALPKKGPSLIIQIAALLGVTVVAVGIGWGSGLYLNGSTTPKAEEAAKTDAHGKPEKPAAVNVADAHSELGVVYLEPITTNLAGPTGTWARLEVAVVFDGGNDAMMAQAIQQDFLAYMRTVKIHQIEGASGFQHLMSDLEERAALRSGGKAKRVLIRTLLLE